MKKKTGFEWNDAIREMAEMPSAPIRNNTIADEFTKLRAENAALRKQLAEAQKDAERYRAYKQRVMAAMSSNGTPVTDEEFDETIDFEAMEAGK